jgi:hypothetical protein
MGKGTHPALHTGLDTSKENRKAVDYHASDFSPGNDVMRLAGQTNVRRSHVL